MLQELLIKLASEPAKRPTACSLGWSAAKPQETLSETKKSAERPIVESSRLAFVNPAIGRSAGSARVSGKRSWGFAALHPRLYAHVRAAD